MPGIAFSDDGDKAEATISAKIIDFLTQLSYSLQQRSATLHPFQHQFEQEWEMVSRRF